MEVSELPKNKWPLELIMLALCGCLQCIHAHVLQTPLQTITQQNELQSKESRQLKSHTTNIH
jgi:hypothetical protein